MEVDPIASMRCWAIDLEVGGRTFTVPALPAVDWWPVLVDMDPTKIIDMVEPGPEDIGDLLLSGEIMAGELGEALTDALTEAAGRSVHVSFVLAALANAQWPEVNGHLVQRGFRWDVMPLGAALDAIYAVAIGGLGKEDREKFLGVLNNEALSNGGKPTKRQRTEVVTEFETMAGPRPTKGVVRASDGPSDSGPPRTPTRSQPRRRDAPSSEPTQQPGPPG